MTDDLGPWVCRVAVDFSALAKKELLQLRGWNWPRWSRDRGCPGIHLGHVVNVGRSLEPDGGRAMSQQSLKISGLNATPDHGCDQSQFGICPAAVEPHHVRPLDDFGRKHPVEPQHAPLRPAIVAVVPMSKNLWRKMGDSRSIQRDVGGENSVCRGGSELSRRDTRG